MRRSIFISGLPPFFSTILTTGVGEGLSFAALIRSPKSLCGSSTQPKSLMNITKSILAKHVHRTGVYVLAKVNFANWVVDGSLLNLQKPTTNARSDRTRQIF